MNSEKVGLHKDASVKYVVMDEEKYLESTKKALVLLAELAELNGFTPHQWVSACCSFIAHLCHDLGDSFEHFKEQMDMMVQSYKRLWDEKRE